VKIIIPSRTTANVAAGVAAIRRRDPSYVKDVIVIDDGMKSRPAGLGYIDGVKPFIFSRNVNLGIAHAGREDVMLLNDDATLTTSNGLSMLELAAAEHPEYGIIAAEATGVGNVNQLPSGIGLRREKRMVCFVAVWIRRALIDAIGMLDERFTAYGFEDDDYCLRARLAGLLIGVCGGVIFSHDHSENGLVSTFRGGGTASLAPGKAIFAQKWGAYA
jgi:hypothetical protein